MRFLTNHIESCFISLVYNTVCHLLHTELHSWFQTNPHPPHVPPKSPTFLFSLRSKTSHLSWVLSFTPSIQSISKFGHLHLQNNLESDYFSASPRLRLPSSFTRTTELAPSLMSGLHLLPLRHSILLSRVVFWKGTSGHVTVLCPNQPWLAPTLPFQLWTRLSPAHSLCPLITWVLEQNQTRPCSKALKLLSSFSSTRSLWLLFVFRSQLKCHLLRVAPWSHYQQ